ncbi:hypothetical protein GCM10009839_29460 [Catenulispora yoronensis]|uniref:DUF7455 domain-containing protein n=1 Tax=Catenulispora yoronensis TaxID=450799 RepID=A0ABP5FKE8_9ACTN
MTTAVLTDTEPLKASDRCDRCGAAAYVRVVLGGGELLFCAHHGKKYNDGLAKVAIEIHDFSDKLTEATPKVAADEER